MNDFIKKCLFLHPNKNKVCIIFGKKSFTYNDLINNINNVIGNIDTHKIGQNDIVALALKDSPYYIFIFWAFLLRGIKTVLINKNFNQEKLNNIIKNSGASYLISDGVSDDYIQGICSNINVISTKELTINNNILKKNKDTSYTPFSTKEDAFYLCSSGSTGDPKCISHSIGDMSYCAESFQKNDNRLLSDDKVYSISKIPFAFGFGNIMYLPFYANASIIVSASNNLVDIYNNIINYDPTVLFSVPTIYNGLLKMNFDEKLIASKLRLSISCGEPLPKVIGEEWEKKIKIPLLEGMGTTEFLYIFFLNTQKARKYGSVGRTLDGYRAVIIDNDGKPADVNKIGNLAISGNSLSTSHNIGRSKLLNGGKYLLTGDKFYKDADSFFWYCGRTNDTFKSGGQWTKAQKIENCLLELPFIDDALVISKHDKHSLSSISAYLVLNLKTNENYITTQNIKKYLRKNLQHFEIPSEYFSVSSLPVGTTGKKKRGYCKQLEGKVIL